MIYKEIKLQELIKILAIDQQLKIFEKYLGDFDNTPAPFF